MSLLPQTIIPPTVPFGKADKDGIVTIEKNWWLLLYNLVNSTIGTGGSGGSTPPSITVDTVDTSDLAGVDIDAQAQRINIENALINALNSGETISSADLPDIARALLLAQDPLVQDPPARAQPVAVVSATGSPFTYVAPSAGSMVVAGTITSVAISRQGTSVATGLTDGIFPLCRYDSLVVTYPAAAPTLTFIPWSSA